ncbi:MAG: class I adenylate-forming enzyme family protein [Pyrobaculum sp.]
MIYWSRITPEKTALCDYECITYGQLLEKALEKTYGGRVLFAARNSVGAFTTLLGLLHGGGVVAIVDPLTVSEDLKYIIEDFSPEIVVGDGEFIKNNINILSKYRYIDEKLVENGRYTAEGQFVMYYAGVVGRTMQVIHNVTSLWICAQSMALAMRLRPEDVVYISAPITHVLGLSTAFASLAAGASIYLMKRLEEKVLEQLKEATVIVGAPAFYIELLKMGVDRLGAKFAISGGAPLPPEAKNEFEKRTGVKILQIYGLTEGLVVTFEPPQLHGRGSIGIPLPLVEVKLAQDGELLVKSPWNMVGYKEPEETRKAFEGGWLKTGDLMEMREGALYFRGVKKRMIKYKGYPIFPRDLEEILKGHPAVVNARVVGEPHPEYGEIPVAYVKTGQPVSEEELLNYVNSRVAFYKKLRKLYLA